MKRAPSRNDERARIAHLAARIMAEDGVEDYALAKRKAARQAGVPDMRQLPGNDEIEEALRTYRQIYESDTQRQRLQMLREKAVRVMRQFAAFNPYLTGSVLSGNAGKYADINLQLFTDDAKAVEMYLLDHNIDYKAAQRTLYCGEERVIVPSFVINDDGTEIEIDVFSPREARVPLKTSPAGKAIERAKLTAVEALLTTT